MEQQYLNDVFLSVSIVSTVLFIGSEYLGISGKRSSVTAVMIDILNIGGCLDKLAQKLKERKIRAELQDEFDRDRIRHTMNRERRTSGELKEDEETETGVIVQLPTVGREPSGGITLTMNRRKPSDVVVSLDTIHQSGDIVFKMPNGRAGSIATFTLRSYSEPVTGSPLVYSFNSPPALELPELLQHSSQSDASDSAEDSSM